MKFRGPFRRLEDRVTGADPFPPGLYHYQKGDRYGGARYHLRIEPDGKSILSVNAQKVLHLNQSATEYAKLYLEGAGDEEVVRRLRSRFKVDRNTALEDFRDLSEKIELLGSEHDVCPVTYLDIECIEPFSTPVSAPYRMDLALTYRCDNECPHCYVERPRDFQEMETERWKDVIGRVWEAGIPHVVFTGGEATLRDDLVELVTYAEDQGLITGLLTNGRLLARDGLMERLEEAGLDHVQVTLESAEESVHDRMVGCPGAWKQTVAGIEAAVASQVYTITNTTITRWNSDTLPATIDFLAGLGLDSIAMNGVIYTGGASGGEMGIPEAEMGGLLVMARDRAISRGMRFIWYTPTRYCSLDPVALGLGPKQCTAARYNMCVEPNGDVIPCQSYYETAGNILTDDWRDIWHAPLLVSIREREFADEECRSCETFGICGAGCPLYTGDGAPLCVESKSSG